MKHLKRIESNINARIAWFTTNGNKMHRINDYRPKQVKDYKTRNERVKWLHKVIRSCTSEKQLKAAERLAELFATHYKEQFSPSAARELEKQMKFINHK